MAATHQEHKKSAEMTPPPAAVAANGTTTTKPAAAGGEEWTRLGKRRELWKPGGRPITGYLFGISGMKMGKELKETLIVRTTAVTDAHRWDADKKVAVLGDSIKDEELAIVMTKGLEDLRAYANDPDFVFKVYIPAGNKKKIDGGHTFWDFTSNPADAIKVSVRKAKRTAATIVQKFSPSFANAEATADAGPTPPAEDDRGSANEDFDEIPF
jgi:hypothetical protein